MRTRVTLMRVGKCLCIGSLMLILLAAGCAPVPVKKEPPPVPTRPEVVTPEEAAQRALEKRRAEARRMLEKAEKAFIAGNYTEAMPLYGEILTILPPGKETALSRLRRGQIYLAGKAYDRAITELKPIPRRYDQDPIYYDAVYHLALAYSRQGDYDRSDRLLEESREGPFTPGRAMDIEILAGENSEGRGAYYEALTAYMKALDREPEEVLQTSIRKRVESIITDRLSIEELEDARKKYRETYPAGYILYTLGTRYFDEGNLEGATTALDTFTAAYEGHPFYEAGEKLHRRLIDIGLVDRHAIGCILPLTGKYAAFGKRALDAIILATGVFDTAGNSPLQLIIEDSKSDPDRAREAVVRLVEGGQVMGIIGPMGSAAAQEAAREAEGRHVPIITLTQKKDITEWGDYIFRNFITSEMQVRTLVNYAFKNLGMRNFAILYPRDNYGTGMMNLFWDEVIAAGGEIRGVESYSSAQTDFSKEIKAVAGVTYVDRGSRLDREPKPTIDFDALFIPDSYTRIAMIAPQLAFYNVTDIQLLGTNSWNSPRLLEGDSEFIDGSIFVDGFFPHSFYPQVRNFIDRFYVAFGREPKDLEALAYDATGILAHVLAGTDIRTRSDVRDGLIALADYPGITGRTSFTETGDVEKSLYVLMARGKEIIQIH